MINQQMLDFIKQQLAKGQDKDIISKELISSGWSTTDTEEGFKTIGNGTNAFSSNPNNNTNATLPVQTQSHSGNKIVLVLVMLLLVGGGASGYYFRNDIPVIKDFIKSNTILPLNEINTEENTQTEIKKEKNQSLAIANSSKDIETTIKTDNKKVFVVTPIKKEPINCGKDMNCFIAASKTCSSAIVEQDQTVDEHVFNRTERRRMTLTGFNPSKNCGFISQIINSTVDYTTEYKTQPVYKNLTNEEKQQWLIRTNAEVRDTIGDIFTCEIPFNSLVDLITNYSKGIYSNSSGFASGSCENSKAVILN